MNSKHYRVLILEDPKINEVFNLLKTEDNMYIKKVSTYKHLVNELKKHNYNLIIVNSTIDNTQYIKMIKHLRDENYWTPVCFYSDIPSKDILRIMDGKNCLTVFKKNILQEDFFKRMYDILYLTSEKGMQTLERLTLLTSDLKKRLYKISNSVQSN